MDRREFITSGVWASILGLLWASDLVDIPKIVDAAEIGQPQVESITTSSNGWMYVDSGGNVVAVESPEIVRWDRVPWMVNAPPICDWDGTSWQAGLE